MGVEVLDDVIISNRVLAAGVRGKQMRRNDRVEVSSGAMYINQGWSQTLRQYEVGFVPMARDDWRALEALYEVTEGGAKGFLLVDPKDSLVATDDGILTALTSTTFQLHKRYTETVSGRTKDRKITRPRATGFALYDGGVLVDPADYTLNAVTGVVTIPAAPPANTLSWAGLFYVPVHFMDDNLEWDLVITGPDAGRRFFAGPTCVIQEIRE